MTPKVNFFMLFVVISALLTSCKIKERAAVNHMFDTDVSELLKLKTQKVTDEVSYVKGNKISNYTILWDTLADLNGNGVFDTIKIYAEEDFYIHSVDEGGVYTGILTINNQQKAFIFNRPQKSYFGAQFKICKLDTLSGFRELIIMQREDGDEDPRPEFYIARYLPDNTMTVSYLCCGESGASTEDIKDGEFYTIETIYSNFDEYSSTHDVHDVKRYIGINSKGLIIKNEVKTQIKRGEILAACPFVYLKSGFDFLYKGEIIRNVIGKNSEATQSLNIGKLSKGEICIRIQEEKDEMSFINFLSLKINGKTIKPSNLPIEYQAILEEDENYISLKKGEFIDLYFTIPNNTNDALLINKGYYIPNALK